MKLILSLDTCDVGLASQVLNQTNPMISHVKIGHIPMAMGSHVIEKMAESTSLFFDFKLHDIPTTMARAFANYQKMYPALSLFTIWGTVGNEALKAVIAEKQQAQVLSVISLSSDVACEKTFLQQVERNLTCGITGFITPSCMIASLRQQFGQEIAIYTPGIRYGQTDDHNNPFTPLQAKKAGADFIIVGRPIVNAPNPRQQCELFYQDCQ